MMSSTRSLRTAALNRRVQAYMLAVLLPILSTVATQHVRWLEAFPFALYFISLGFIATLGGVGPNIVGFLCILLSRYWLQGASLDPALAPVADRYRYGILMVCTFIISFVAERRLVSEGQLEIALAELRERTEALVESLNTGKCASWTADFSDEPRIYWYGGSFPIFGRPFDEIADPTALRSLAHPEDQHIVLEIDQYLLKAKDPLVREFRCLWPNGETHWLEVRGTRLPGRKPRWRGVTLDITERRKAEVAILRAEKLAAMGRLASTVAHEINNPLEAVTNLLYIALNDPGLTPEARGYLADAETQLARLGNVTRLSLNYMPQSGNSSRVELPGVLDEVLAFFHHRAEIRSAEITRLYAPDSVATIAPDEIHQIVTNLVANVADALSNVPSPAIHLETSATEKLVTITIADNGTGIPESNMERIFEPFFTTKEEVGTGLGLWVTRELVEKNGGRIEAFSGTLPGGMTTSFRIELPRANA